MKKILSFDDISKLKVGDTFFEKGYETYTSYTLTKVPNVLNNSVVWEGRDKDGTLVDFMLTQGMEAYGPDIFTP